MNKNVKKIWNMMTSLFVALILILSFLLVGVKFIGLDIYIVLSGSMEPSYPTGSLIYVKEANIQELNTGDVVTFRLSEHTIVTHRIIEVLEENHERMFRTKGDANDVEDGSLLKSEQIIGTPVFMIPYLGFIASYIQSKSGFYLMIALGAALVLLILIPELFPEEKQ